MIEEDLQSQRAAEAFPAEMAEIKESKRTAGKKKNQDPVDEQPKGRKSDKYIWAIFITLCIISIIEQYSASSREVSAAHIMKPILTHCGELGLGAVAAMICARIPYKWFIPLTPIIVIVSVMCAIYVLFNGEVINGAARSFKLMGIPIQPAELLKLSAVLLIALVMSYSQEEGGVTTRGVAFCAGAVLFFGGLLFTQGLTNTVLLMGISCSMMLISGVQWRKFGVVVLVYCVAGAGGLVYKVMHEDKSENQVLITETGRDEHGNKATIDRFTLWKQRLASYQDTIPKYKQRITDKNRQEMHSYRAQANGGITGVGPGNSRESARLPLANLDFVYAIVIEDLGLIGGLFVLLLYLSLLGRAGSIASRCQRVFPAMLVMGMAVYIVFQALCHMAIVTGVTPVSGQPLPMISKGGTSILITSVAFGIMLSVSRFAVRDGQKKEIEEEKAELPDGMQGQNPTKLS